ncbi:hypothetical protein, partial [Serratia marcescens]|uniref:hypothetical protein n=1 Tax=Serratia marcescens TaxID=615 RepID=UPI000ABD76C1
PAGRSSFSTKTTDTQNQNSPQMFAIREDEERRYWLYVWHKGHWPLVLDVPFKTQGAAVDAAFAFNFATLYN